MHIKIIYIYTKKQVHNAKNIYLDSTLYIGIWKILFLNIIKDCIACVSREREKYREDWNIRNVSTELNKLNSY